MATRVLATYDEAGNYEEDLFYTHDALKNTTALFGIIGGRRASYSYGAYGQTLAMEGNAAASNPFRFSSEYADEELGLIYYNYRHYNPLDGRWISRESLGEAMSLGLYSFSDNSPTGLFDALGFNVYGIDGTNYNVELHPEQRSNVHDFVKRVAESEQKKYFGGPASNSSSIGLGDITGWYGPGHKEIQKNVYTTICKDFCLNKRITINLVGWSRGAVIAQEIARNLGSTGCCCGGKNYRPIRVNFLGLYDAVGMNLGATYHGKRPENVDHYHHAIKSEFQLGFSTLTTRDPNERVYPNKDGSKSSHGDIGGTENGKPNPAHSAMVNWAKNSGVKINNKDL